MTAAWVQQHAHQQYSVNWQNLQRGQWRGNLQDISMHSRRAIVTPSWRMPMKDRQNCHSLAFATCTIAWTARTECVMWQTSEETHRRDDLQRISIYSRKTNVFTVARKSACTAITELLGNVMEDLGRGPWRGQSAGHQHA